MIYRRLLQDLYDLPESLRSSAVGLEANDAVIEQENGILFGVVGRFHGELVDRVGLYGGITLLGDPGCLCRKDGGREQKQGYVTEHRDSV